MAARALSTVQDYVAQARVLLQDLVSPYRNTDDEIVTALNSGLMEARRLRAELFYNRTLPSFTTNDTTVVVFDEQYRMSLLYYVVGLVQLRDAEDTTDARASIFLNKLTEHLVGAK